MSDTSGEGLTSQGREENQGSAQLPLPSEEKRSPPRTRALPPSALLIFIFFFLSPSTQICHHKPDRGGLSPG